MDSVIQLISDGDGLAVIGEATDVEQYLDAEKLPSNDLDLRRIETLLHGGAATMQAMGLLASQSGRYVQLTSESVEKINEIGLMPSTIAGVSHAMLGKPGQIEGWIQIVTPPAGVAINPAMLAGAAGIMSQFAMQQSMQQITAYLETIDEKIDAVLRAQTNQVLARIDGVALALKEAMKVREAVGRVSEVTWSKVQNSAQTIHETQAYALRQLADIADFIEKGTRVDDLAKKAKEAESEVRKCLTILAHCLKLHDAIAVLELDRVLDSSPDDIEQHRVGLKVARHERLEIIARTAEGLLEPMRAAVGTANSKVLLNPLSSPAVVESTNRVADHVHEFQGLLGIESGRQSAEARRWAVAAAEQWDKTRETGAEGIVSVKNFGIETRKQAQSVTGKLFDRVRERRSRPPG